MIKLKILEIELEMLNKQKKRKDKMQKNNINILKNQKDNLWKMVYQWIKFNSKYLFYSRLKKNNIYIQIYDKLNNNSEK